MIRLDREEVAQRLGARLKDQVLAQVDNLARTLVAAELIKSQISIIAGALIVGLVFE